DPTATALLKDIEAARGTAASDAKKKEDYNRAMTAARTALAAKKYDDAIRDANDALKLFPGDKDALALVKEATTAKTSGDAEKKRPADYNAAVQGARAALGQKKYDEALRLATEASKIFPGDKAAQDLVKEIQAAKAAADTDAARRTAYTQHIAAAQKAMA